MAVVFGKSSKDKKSSKALVLGVGFFDPLSPLRVRFLVRGASTAPVDDGWVGHCRRGLRGVTISKSSPRATIDSIASNASEATSECLQLAIALSVAPLASKLRRSASSAGRLKTTDTRGPSRVCTAPRRTVGSGPQVIRSAGRARRKAHTEGWHPFARLLLPESHSGSLPRCCCPRGRVCCTAARARGRHHGARSRPPCARSGGHAIPESGISRALTSHM